MQMGTARILSPLCVFLSRSSFLSPVTEQCRALPLLHYHVSISVSVSFYSYPCLFCPLAVCLPVRCCCLRLLLLLLSLVCVLSVLHLIFIRFYFPFLLRSFFFFFAAHIFLSFGTRETRKIQNREQKTPPSGGRGKLKMRLRLKLHDKRIAKCCMFSSSSSGSRDSALSLLTPPFRLRGYC